MLDEERIKEAVKNMKQSLRNHLEKNKIIKRKESLLF